MKDYQSSSYLPSPEITHVADSIIRQYFPKALYLYNQRTNALGDTSSFKLCIIADTKNKLGIEQEIYMKIDSEIPYDILIYTPQEWERLSERETSFASRIKETGAIIYGKA